MRFVQRAETSITPDIASRYYPLEITFDTRVDQNLSPFSAEYYEQQLALYCEIAGRPLDQETGELHPDDVSHLLDSPTPLGDGEAEIAAEQMRSLAGLVSLARLGAKTRVLDVGAGGGMSSEVFALAGCQVHAIDIDPALGAFARERARRRGLPIERSDMNFDDMGRLASGAYDAAFFFQSFHHCLKPWELIETLADKLVPNGVIGFTGEPLQSRWWRNWGLRLDHESIFAARHFGWFESGWSHDFMRECLARCGFETAYFTGGFLTGEYTLATRDPIKMEAIRAAANRMDLHEMRGSGELVDGRFGTVIGVRDVLHGRPAMRQMDGRAGTLMFGPYARLDAGTYEVALIARGSGGGLVIDAIAEIGGVTLMQETVEIEPGAGDRSIVKRLTLERPLDNVEVRAFVAEGGQWVVTLPSLTRV